MGGMFHHRDNVLKGLLIIDKAGHLQVPWLHQADPDRLRGWS